MLPVGSFAGVVPAEDSTEGGGVDVEQPPSRTIKEMVTTMRADRDAATVCKIWIIHSFCPGQPFETLAAKSDTLVKRTLPPPRRSNQDNSSERKRAKTCKDKNTRSELPLRVNDSCIKNEQKLEAPTTMTHGIVRNVRTRLMGKGDPDPFASRPSISSSVIHKALIQRENLGASFSSNSFRHTEEGRNVKRSCGTPL